MTTYYVYGWNLDYFEKPMFTEMLPKRFKRSTRDEILEFYLDDNSSINVFALDDGIILGIMTKDKFRITDLRDQIKDVIDENLGKMITSEFRQFLLLNQPRIYEVIR